MKYKLMRNNEIERIGSVSLPANIRTTIGGWTVMARSNNYMVLRSLLSKLYPKDGFRIEEENVT